MEHTAELRKTVGDMSNAIVSYVGLLGMLPDILAAIASLLSIIWFGIRFYEYFKNKKEIK